MYETQNRGPNKISHKILKEIQTTDHMDHRFALNYTQRIVLVCKSVLRVRA